MSGAQKLREFFRGARRKTVYRVSNDIRMRVLCQMKPDCHSARACIWIIVRYRRHTGKVRKSNCDRRLFPLQVGGTGE